MKLSLIPDLNESRMYRSKQTIKQVTARQVADHAFMDLIALWILYNENAYSPFAISYATKTAGYGRFSNYMQSNTDLYMNLHILSNKRTDLLDSQNDSVLLDRIHINPQEFIRYLRMISTNKASESFVRTFLQKFEQRLVIETSNYRSVRRQAQNWQKLSTSAKRTTITRMLMFYKTNARRSEMFQMLTQMAKLNNYHDPSAKNPEIDPKAKLAAAAAAATAGLPEVGH